MCAERVGIVELDFHEGTETPILHIACNRKGITDLLGVVRELAAGRMTRYDLRRLESVHMKFEGEVFLEVISPRRWVDNVDITMQREDEKLQIINWRASKDEWHDDVDRIAVLADSTTSAFQYLSLPSCAVGVKVSFSLSLENGGGDRGPG